MSPRWNARQQAMLEALGLRVWAPAQPVASSATAADAEVAGLAPRIVGLSEPGRPGAAAAAAATGVADLTLPTGSAAPPVALMDWADLRAAVAACTACTLCANRTNTVFGTGHPRARWMIVGEAPGEQEDLRGEPFVGRSGQLLDSMLAALGLTRAEAADGPRQVYIANTLKCRPPANRNPEPAELAQCEPFLTRQIELVGPAVILALGRFAAQALLRSAEPIGRLRGRVHHYRGVPLVVTYHPAYLLRNLADKARAWEDLCLAREVALGAGAGE